jgi:hypothetical protein
MMTPRKRGRQPLIPNRTKLAVYMTRRQSRQIARVARAQRPLAAPENADAR